MEEGVLTKYTFSQKLKDEGLSDRTIELYSSIYNVVDKYFDKIDPPLSGGPEDMEKFELRLRPEIKKFRFLHRRKYYAATMVYYFLYRYGLEISLPRGKRYKEPPRKMRNLAMYDNLKSLVEQLEKSEKPLRPQEKIVLDLFLYTGRRVAEILKLKVSDIDFEKNYILFQSTKGGIPGSTPMSERIRALLKKYINENELLGGDLLYFDRGWGKPSKSPIRNRYNLFRYHIWAVNSKLAEELNKTHNFRRGVISRQVVEKSIEHANAWVGQKSLETTKRYANELSQKTKQLEAMDVMD
jgi:integrase/recombinase XerC/integrase/recombinase XerD